MKEFCTIEPAELSDVLEITAMHRELAEYCDYDMRNFKITNQNVSDIVSASTESSYFTARTQQDMSGMVLCHRIPLSWTGVPGVYIEDLYVRPAARGYGIGKYLVRAACELALTYADGDPDAAYIRLDTSAADNEDTLSFYRRLGMHNNNTNFRLYGQTLGRLAATS